MRYALHRRVGHGATGRSNQRELGCGKPPTRQGTKAGPPFSDPAALGELGGLVSPPESRVH